MVTPDRYTRKPPSQSRATAQPKSAHGCGRNPKPPMNYNGRP